MEVYMTDIKKEFLQFDWKSLLVNCADQADDIARHYYDKVDLSITEKEDKSVVSEGDIEIEKHIRSYIASHCPSLEIYGEEFGACDRHAPYKLIIDPIDGTSNFVRKIPVFGTLLGIEIDGQVIAGLVSNPIMNDRWVALRDKGATYNEEPIQVSSIQSLNNAQGFYGSLYGREARGHTDQLLKLLSKTKRQRGIGDFLMHMWVANGYGEFGIDFNLQPWDLAPLGIIVEEAGGVVTATSGASFDIYEGSILSSNGCFHNDIVSVYQS